MPDSVALLVYGKTDSGRNALTEEKYKDLALALQGEGFDVESVLYHDESAGDLAAALRKFNAVLVWINPVEPGLNRKHLDLLLEDVASAGVFVSAQPRVILKIGAKDVLYKTRELGWTGYVDLYRSPSDFASRFPFSLESAGVRVLKQYRGNGGNGGFKVSLDRPSGRITVVHAQGYGTRVYTAGDFFTEFRPFFDNDGLLIEQEWNANMVNGMVRCYVSGTRVAGFGYQEVNALYETRESNRTVLVPPGKRHYYSENCGLFSDLRQVMEQTWIPELQSSQGLADSEMPVIWDADFFINAPNHSRAPGKYSLCEINVSCVSPFPPSAVRYIVETVKRNLMDRASG